MITPETYGQRVQRLQIWQLLRFYEEGVIPEPLPTCKETGKVSYRRLRNAEKACEWLAKQYGDTSIMPYRCRRSKHNPKRCDQWHIGHPWWAKKQPVVGDKAREKAAVS